MTDTRSRCLRGLLAGLLLTGCGDPTPPAGDADVALDTADAVPGDTQQDTVLPADTGDATDGWDAVDAADTAGDAADTDAYPDTCPAPDSTPSDTGAPDGNSTAGCALPQPVDFDDHTVLSFADADDDCMIAYGGAVDPPQIKFVVVDFNQTAVPATHFMDPRFYALHDEWSWFRLLNGAAIPGWRQAPVQGPRYETIAEIYAALVGTSPLPLGMRFLEHSFRLYNPSFYAHAGLIFDGQQGPRFFGLGSLIHYAAQPNRPVPEAVWVFQLEVSDAVDETTLLRFFSILEGTLPAGVGTDLRWLARSAAQEGLARSLRDGGGPYAARVMTLDDLVAPGEVEVYNPGITAGRLVIVRGDTLDPAALHPDEIAILARVPDDIPPVAAIVSAVPQTPLAHVNLLAQARGTPNAYAAGVLGRADLALWSDFRYPVLLEVAEGRVHWQRLQTAQWNIYSSNRYVPERVIPQVEDLPNAPLFVDLTGRELAEMAALVPLIGGKAAGFIALTSAPDIETPPAPLGVSVRAYDAHVAPLDTVLRALVADPDFQQDARARFVALEGAAAFGDQHGADPGAAYWLAGFIADHVDDTLGTVIRQGGVVQMIRDLEVPAELLAAIEAQLATRFADLSVVQGLRFRSSATAEDVVGFNGAGLYDSNTGFLDPSAQERAKDRKKSVAWALKKTWASYWGFPAFEERATAHIDHFDGRMGVVIHPRFDDPLEDANGVITYHLSNYTAPPLRRMVVNVQAGALSVTNPEGGLARPEVDVIDGPPGARAVTRERLSSETCGAEILSEAELLALDAQVGGLAVRWLEAANADGPSAERARSVVLDLEFKRVKAGWPQLQSGEVRPSRLVIKQVRVLDQAPVVPEAADPWVVPNPPTVPAAPPITASMPRDLRTAARRVVSASCTTEAVSLRLYSLETEPEAALFPFADTRFAYRAWLSFGPGAQGLEPPEGSWRVSHLSFEEARFTDQEIALVFSPSTADHFDADSLVVRADGSWTLTRGGVVRQGQDASCEPTRVPYASPEEYLRSLIVRPE